VSKSLLRMDYRIELRPVGAADWVSLLTGKYISSGSARRGEGDIHLLASNVRNAGYPVDADPGLVNLLTLDIVYANADFPVTVMLDIATLKGATTELGHYAYSQQQDGSGLMSFDWEGRADSGALITARMLSQWIGSGAGRADLTADLTPNRTGVVTPLGTDCWGVDAVASYRFRPNENPQGDPASCLF
jgi:hypothetical protein